MMHPYQQRLLRRILIWFALIVVLLPIAGFGGRYTWLLIPLIVVASFALRDALSLRRGVVDDARSLDRIDDVNERSDSVD